MVGQMLDYAANGVVYWPMIGQTSEVEARKGLRATSERRQWDEESLFADLAEKCGEVETRTARALYDWTVERGWPPKFGKGKQDGSWIPVISLNGRDYTPIVLFSNGRIYVRFGFLARRAPFDDDQIRLEMLRRVNEFPGISCDPRVIATEASLPMLSVFAEDPSALEQLKRLLEWVAEQATAAG